jgi:hypothetical protein
MSAFDLERSLARAAQRLRYREALATSPGRKARRDRGRPRLDPTVQAELERLLQERDRPAVRALMTRLAEHCAAHGLRPPARATIYQAFDQIPARRYRIADLPPAARETLYNLSPEGEVPGHQLAFYCFNYGGLEAMSFAAGLPWLALHQAARLPGWRPRSRGLLEAIRRVRGL